MDKAPGSVAPGGDSREMVDPKPISIADLVAGAFAASTPETATEPHSTSVAASAPSTTEAGVGLGSCGALAENAGRVLHLAVLSSFELETPFVVCAADRAGSTALVTLYNLSRAHRLRIGDRVSVLQPACRLVRLRLDRLRALLTGDADANADATAAAEASAAQQHPEAAAEAEFKLVRVDQPLNLLVNGKPLSKEAFASAELHAQSLPE